MHENTMKELNKRKLQLNEDKCARLHVSSKSKKENNKCEDLKIDIWEVETEEGEEGITSKDVYKGKRNIQTVKE